MTQYSLLLRTDQFSTKSHIHPGLHSGIPSGSPIVINKGNKHKVSGHNVRN